MSAVADLGGGQGGLGGGGEMVSAQYLRGARRGGGIFWPEGQKFWARGEMKTCIRHWMSGSTYGMEVRQELDKSYGRCGKLLLWLFSQNGPAKR